MIRRVGVIVPAADEQERIAACLRAIERARRRILASQMGVDRVDVFVVLDACRDDTAAVVARFAALDGVHPLTSSARCVGAARQRGALRAIATLGPVQQLWLANTDADSQVPGDWLIRMVLAANAEARLVLGTVLPNAELPRALRATWLEHHELRADHPHVHGANLGIRADTFLSIGGWRELRFNEDIDLVDRAVAAGEIGISRTAEIPVVTSARLVGRAPGGFSSYLRHLKSSSTSFDRYSENGA